VASLVLRGWRILGRGVVTGRGSGAGEIDIVARRGNLIAFIEVKARTTLAEAGAAISAIQRDRLARAAGAYVARHPALAGCDIRFDAMLVAPRRAPRHLKDAWREAG
jgi:putative endonuclease